MKKLFPISILLLSLISCARNNNSSPTPSIIAKWKQTALYNSNGGSSPAWQQVTNGYTIEFFNNGTFTSTKHSECAAGNYTVSASNKINMTYTCAGFTNSYLEEIEANTNTELILKPTYLNCDEGCSVKSKNSIKAKLLARGWWRPQPHLSMVYPNVYPTPTLNF